MRWLAGFGYALRRIALYGVLVHVRKPHSWLGALAFVLWWAEVFRLLFIGPVHRLAYGYRNRLLDSGRVCSKYISDRLSSSVSIRSSVNLTRSWKDDLILLLNMSSNHCKFPTSFNLSITSLDSGTSRRLSSPLYLEVIQFCQRFAGVLLGHSARTG
jgi:hypothetical protein